MSKYIIIIVNYLVIALMLPYLINDNKKTVKKMGKCLLALPRKSSWRGILVDIIAVIIPLILLIRDFGNMNYLFMGCSLLSFFIMTKESFAQKYYGVYENGFIAPSAVIFYSELLAFPVFELPEDDQAHYPKNSLIVVTTKKSRQEIIFPTDEECAQFVAKLREINVIKPLDD